MSALAPLLLSVWFFGPGERPEPKEYIFYHCIYDPPAVTIAPPSWVTIESCRLGDQVKPKKRNAVFDKKLSLERACTWEEELYAAWAAERGNNKRILSFLPEKPEGDKFKWWRGFLGCSPDKKFVVTYLAQEPVGDDCAYYYGMTRVTYALTHVPSGETISSRTFCYSNVELDFSGFVLADPILAYFAQRNRDDCKPILSVSKNGDWKEMGVAADCLVASPNGRSIVLCRRSTVPGECEMELRSVDLSKIKWQMHIRWPTIIWSTDSRIVCLALQDPTGQPMKFYCYNPDNGELIGDFTMPFKEPRSPLYRLVHKSEQFDPFDAFGLEPLKTTAVPTSQVATTD